MIECTICKREVEINKVGCIAMHRISDEYRHRYSFCDMSGKPVELVLKARAA